MEMFWYANKFIVSFYNIHVSSAVFAFAFDVVVSALRFDLFFVLALITNFSEKFEADCRVSFNQHFWIIIFCYRAVII